MKGRVPAEDNIIRPRRPRGSHRLAWDECNMAAKAARPPGGGDGDGEHGFARTAGGGFRLGPLRGDAPPCSPRAVRERGRG